jgi:hypothetical protein
MFAKGTISHDMLGRCIVPYGGLEGSIMTPVCVKSQ